MINKVGILGETIGQACYQNKLDIERENNKAMMVFQNKKPTRSPIFRGSFGPTAFILPSLNGIRIYKIIVNNAVFIITAYDYLKLTRTIYRKTCLILSKRQKIRKRQQLQRSLTKTAKFLSASIFIHKVRKSNFNSNSRIIKSNLFSAV